MKLGVIIMAILLIPSVLAGQIKIYPIQDSYTDSSKPNNVFNNPNLRAGNDVNHGRHRSYLKFDTSSLNGKNIESAEFKIDGVGYVGSFRINLHYVNNDNWNEQITWNSAPVHNQIIDFEVIDSNGWYGFDVSSVINEDDNVLSLALVSNIESSEGNYVQFFSKDLVHEDYWPYLDIDVEGGECPSEDYSNVCCGLSPIEMMGFINKFNRFETKYSPIEMMNFINKFNRFESLC